MDRDETKSDTNNKQSIGTLAYLLFSYFMMTHTRPFFSQTSHLDTSFFSRQLFFLFFTFSFWQDRTNSIINQPHRLSFHLCPTLTCVFYYFNNSSPSTRLDHVLLFWTVQPSFSPSKRHSGTQHLIQTGSLCLKHTKARPLVNQLWPEQLQFSYLAPRAALLSIFYAPSIGILEHCSMRAR